MITWDKETEELRLDGEHEGYASPAMWERIDELLQKQDVEEPLLARIAELEAGLRELVEQVGTRYDDQWATGPVLLADLDTARSLLAPAQEDR